MTAADGHRARRWRVEVCFIRLSPTTWHQLPRPYFSESLANDDADRIRSVECDARVREELES